MHGIMSWLMMDGAVAPNAVNKMQRGKNAKSRRCTFALLGHL